MAATENPSSRNLSIDVFRGFAVANMVFFNDLDGVSNIPWWLKHAPQHSNIMTYVDAGFLGFLFIIGLSIPFSIKSRRKKGESTLRIWQHILVRSLLLIAIGAFMVFAEQDNSERAIGMSRYLWALLMYAGFILALNQYPQGRFWKKWTPAFRWVGVILLASLFAIYSIGYLGKDVFLPWPGILGTIGWCYFFAATVFLLVRPFWGLVLAMIVFLLFHQVLLWIKPVMTFFSFDFLPYTAGIVCGSLVSLRLFDERYAKSSIGDRIRWLLVFSFMLAVGGYVTEPFYGISIIWATPGGILYSLSMAVPVYLFFYWIVEMRHAVRWADFLMPAAVSPLFLYIFSEMIYPFFDLFNIDFHYDHFRSGGPGIIHSLVFTVAVIFVFNTLTRYVRLKL